MEILTYLTNALTEALHQLHWPDQREIFLDRPKDPHHGDLATNLALSLAKAVQLPPRKTAEALVEHLTLDPRLVAEVRVAGPGFINFFLSPTYLQNQLQVILKQGANYGRSQYGAGAPVMVEFVSSNPTGPLHIGHGRQAALGDSIAALLESLGYHVTREYYFNDAGRQMDLLARSLWARYQELFGRPGEIPEEGYRGQYLVEIAQRLKDRVGDRYLDRDPEAVLDFLRTYAADEIVKLIDEDLRRFRITFDVWTRESALYETSRVQKTLEGLRELGLSYQKDGATWFRATAFGDSEDRVLVKSSGEPTYFLPDLAYHIQKRERGFRHVINIWGADHHGYVPRMKAAMKALGAPDEFLDCIIHQLVTFIRDGQEVKTSTRRGLFITLRELIDEVGVDAARYFFVMRRADSHLLFDLTLAKSQSEENPVYYVQYAHARMASLMATARKDPQTASLPDELDRAEGGLLSQPEELALMKHLAFYPLIVHQAALAREPHRITAYLEELAGTFHHWYHHHRVLNEPRPLARSRLCLARATQIVIANGLSLLGVSAPESM